MITIKITAKTMAMARSKAKSNKSLPALFEILPSPNVYLKLADGVPFAEQGDTWWPITFLEKS